MSALTFIHTAISLIAIISGVAVAFGLITGQRLDRSTLVFMVTTIATLITGFLFPYHGFTPAIGVGILCVLIFIPTAIARYRYHLAGWWRPVFVIGSIVLFYFNCLVLIVQSFQKIPPLNALAPTGNEPIVAICQSVLLIAFVVLGFFSVRRFRSTIAAI